MAALIRSGHDAGARGDLPKDVLKADRHVKGRFVAEIVAGTQPGTTGSLTAPHFSRRTWACNPPRPRHRLAQMTPRIVTTIPVCHGEKFMLQTLKPLAGQGLVGLQDFIIFKVRKPQHHPKNSLS